MSKARSRRKRPSDNPQTPERGSKGWIRIIARGCGGWKDEWTGEYDCTHYTWSCDECPWCIEKQEEKENEWREAIMQIQGPPRPPDQAELELFICLTDPATATELERVMNATDTYTRSDPGDGGRVRQKDLQSVAPA